MARLALFFYTLFASLPLLFIIIIIFNNRNINNLIIINYIKTYILFNKNFFIKIILILTFLVKFPIFFLHSWLPKAHVEAPVSGSILLAGIILKLGGYGFIRLLFLLQKNSFFEIIICVRLIGGRVLSILCLAQRDIKVVIAYSSVVHIAIVIVSVISTFFIGFDGALIIILGHGLVSSGIFRGANIIYERSHSRRYLLNSGFSRIIPHFSFFWFILIVANFSGPFSYNILGEILLILNISQINKFILIILCFLSFFSAAYRLILYSSTQHGKYNNILHNIFIFNSREIIIQYSHVWPLLLILLSARLIYLSLNKRKNYYF